MINFGYKTHFRARHWVFFWKESFKFKSPFLKGGILWASSDHMKITDIAFIWFSLCQELVLPADAGFP